MALFTQTEVMSQDTERQIQLQFLDEAQDYLDTIESVVLGLSRPSGFGELDAALRAAHSIKGGAGMMGFLPLSELAHRLEDALKVVKVRPHLVDTAVETLLLQGVDGLRQVRDWLCQWPEANRHRQGISIDSQWLAQGCEPVFDRLLERLGTLEPEDENLLLGIDQDSDLAVSIFESEVEGLLQRLEQVLADPEQPGLREELATRARELEALGQMLQMPEFCQLCLSVQQQLAGAESVAQLARQAVEVWWRARALVMVGNPSLIPTTIDNNQDSNPSQEELPLADHWDIPAEAIADIEGEEEPFPELATLSQLEGVFSQEDLESVARAVSVEFEAFEQAHRTDRPIDSSSHGHPVADLAAALEDSRSGENLDSWGTAIPDETEVLASLEESQVPAPGAKTDMMAEATGLESTWQPQEPQVTVRVSVEQLDRLNGCLGDLVTERNGLWQRLSQLQDLCGRMRSRVRYLEKANTELRKVYDRVASDRPGDLEAEMTPSLMAAIEANQANPSLLSEFDTLEFDRYGPLHALSQEQMETCVQIYEIMADLELGLGEAERSTRAINRAVKELQSGMSRIRMRPFAEITGSFSRAVRDLAVQFDKPVELVLQGTATLVDRTVLEALRDPLMHLLRNAFDHGIESPAIRAAANKSPTGCISISAAYRSNEIQIRVADDGGGINLDKIRDRARQLGIEDERLAAATEKELLELIFEPGFSTAARVTSLSGRGVGMDVVRTNLESVKGKIEVETTRGQGTTFILSVPLTLASARVLLVESRDFILGIPVDEVEEILHPQPKQIVVRDGREIFYLGGQPTRCLRLSDGFSFNHALPQRPKEALPVIDEVVALIVSDGKERYALLGDRYWGEQEVSVRAVDSPVPLPEGFVGCTVAGNGRVVPIASAAVSIGVLLQGKEQTLTAAGAESSGNIDTTEGACKTVLVVDDSANVRRLLALSLERAGYHVEQAKDGQEAVEKLEAGLLVQGVICDIEMPRLDGYGVLARVRSQPSRQQLPVIMLTSRSGEKHRQLAQRLGATAYFSKPYNEQSLLQELDRVISMVAVA